mmetsp:Transcript_46341/g.120304  ORF Transcript_46341/g.120304 Transcript_46341/m.120304 type:complete len:200 (-) Transcript_46341:179-778(-)
MSAPGPEPRHERAPPRVQRPSVPRGRVPRASRATLGGRGSETQRAEPALRACRERAPRLPRGGTRKKCRYMSLNRVLGSKDMLMRPDGAENLPSGQSGAAAIKTSGPEASRRPTGPAQRELARTKSCIGSRCGAKRGPGPARRYAGGAGAPGSSSGSGRLLPEPGEAPSTFCRRGVESLEVLPPLWSEDGVGLLAGTTP